MYNSYKDALVLGKVVEKPIKPVQPKQIYKLFSTGEIKKMCGKGTIDKLKLVNPTYFTNENIIMLNNFMNNKINEIEIWKLEDNNQYDGILEELDDRINGIKECVQYINSFNKKETSD